MNAKECTDGYRCTMPSRRKRLVGISVGLLLLAFFATGCLHYPVNPRLKQYNPEIGYRGKNMGEPGNSDKLLLLLTFSGGGTRAAAFSYGVLEELKKTEVTIEGERRRLLDEIDGISSVSGGSFTSGYYGLFGERIFEDFEKRFLKKNIQGALISKVLFNPVNWVRFFSPYFDRSDLAAEYYDKQVFDNGTFGDIAARKGPMIVMNATDMITGIRIPFNQDSFDVLCSDVSRFPVARAAAASSAVPIVLTPITLRNYAGSCGYQLPEPAERSLQERDTSSWQYQQLKLVTPYLDARKKPYIHLLDGGLSDNLGLRAVLDRVIIMGDVWTTLKYAEQEDVQKIVFIVVNAEKAISNEKSLLGTSPGLKSMLKSSSSLSITRYNFETVMLLRASMKQWKREVQQNRCKDGPSSTKPGACGDIKFYLIEVKFDALPDEEERTYFTKLPTSFKLSDEEVDRLRDAAHRILTQSEDFQRLVSDLR